MALAVVLSASLAAARAATAAPPAAPGSAPVRQAILSDYRVVHWTTAQGLPQNSVNNIVRLANVEQALRDLGRINDANRSAAQTTERAAQTSSRAVTTWAAVSSPLAPKVHCTYAVTSSWRARSVRFFSRSTETFTGSCMGTN